MVAADPGPAAHVWPFWMEPIDPRFSLAFSVRIEGQPHGKGSVRVVDFEDRKGRIRKKGISAPKSRRYEDLIAQLCRYQRPGEGFELPLDGPLLVRVLSVQRRPLRVAKKLFLPLVEGEPDGRLYAPVKPDFDNLAKSVCDGMAKGGAIAMDSRFCDGRVVTAYGIKGEKPFIEAYVFAVR